MRFHPDRPATGTAAAVRLAEGLVQVVVDGVEAHPARIGLAEDGVEVGAVVVHLAAGTVDDLGDLTDIRLEEPECRGIGDHHRSGVIPDGPPECCEV